MTDDEIIAVVTARKAGKTIQYRTQGTEVGWSLMGNATPWDFSLFDYRVKPEPRECFQAVDQNGEPLSEICEVRGYPDVVVGTRGSGCRVIRFVEDMSHD